MSDASHTFESYYKRATSPLVVLCLLRDGAMYGYQISQEMDVRSNGRFTIAVLYPRVYPSRTNRDSQKSCPQLLCNH